MDLNNHTSHEYDEELKAIRSKVLTMGGIVEQQVKDATKALLKSNMKLADKAATSDHLVNDLEIEIDEESAQIIAKRQPAARDLRTVITVMKVINDLERIGDEAEKIARLSLELSDKSTLSDFRRELKHMVKLSRHLLVESLDCFARMDDIKAAELTKVDAELDHEFDNLARLLVSHAMEDPRTIKNILKINWCARALERIGDHAINICEYVVYLVKGKDIRHTTGIQAKSE